MLLDRIDGMGHGACRSRMADFHCDRIMQHLVRQSSDIIGHGGGEHQRLAFKRHLFDDPSDIRQKAHVEHPVRFVEDKDFQARKVDRFLVKVIEQPAGTGDDDIDAGAQFLDLRVQAHAAVYRAALQVCIASQFSDRYMGLFRQFACGRNNQAAYLAAWTRKQTLQNRQHEGCCFAGPGHGKAHNVLACEDRRNRLYLDRSRGFVAERLDASGYFRMKLKRAKTHSTSYKKN